MYVTKNLFVYVIYTYIYSRFILYKINLINILFGRMLTKAVTLLPSDDLLCHTCKPLSVVIKVTIQCLNCHKIVEKVVQQRTIVILIAVVYI